MQRTNAPGWAGLDPSSRPTDDAFCEMEEEREASPPPPPFRYYVGARLETAATFFFSLNESLRTSV